MKSKTTESKNRELNTQISIIIISFLIFSVIFNNWDYLKQSLLGW